MTTANISDTACSTRPRTAFTGRQMLNKVPEITVYFWVIKILCTTVGETAADYINSTLGLGLTNTTYIMGALLAVALVAQFWVRRYIASIYWIAVVLISVVGTLITDNLTDNFGVSLVTSTIIFSVALAATFAVWFGFEKTLSIHTIMTTRREAFYWLAVLFTFALGTAGGDLLAERLDVGYEASLVIFSGAIILVYFLNYQFKLNSIVAFWLAYILTRPLGATLGDFMSQKSKNGGLGLGTQITSLVFLAIIVVVVIFLVVTKVDKQMPQPGIALPPRERGPEERGRVLVVTNKTAATDALVDAVRDRAAASPVSFFMLVPNPAHLAFDRASHDTGAGAVLLAEALPALEQATESAIQGRVAASPNAFDDIVAELNSDDYSEVIIETPPSHMTHWLHIDLPERIQQFGYPVTVVSAADRD